METGLTFSYACIPAFRSILVIIFAGPCSPKFMAEAFVASENVGDGGPLPVGGALCFGRLVEMASERSERGFGMSLTVRDLNNLGSDNVIRAKLRRFEGKIRRPA